jgi:glycosyltransferase involved in cell wall biosynthesis
MQARRRKIVVLTPVRNEEWILETFLKVTSQFADLIIIADQGSTDGSLSICRNFEKVYVISNPDQKYDEASRQRLLIQTARELVPGERILLALDSDEILAANARGTGDWQRMLSADSGTVLIFEKPNLYRTAESCIRYEIDFPGGYIDDGAEHIGAKVHSIRIPVSDGAPRLILGDIKFLHYALLRPKGQAAKLRMYSVVENLAKTKNVFQRRKYYDAKDNWEKHGRVEGTDPKWFSGWEQLGIDVRSIRDEEYYWQDYETLSYLTKYGSLRFWLDDIWEFDWRELAESEGERTRILAPPVFFRNFLRFSIKGLSALATLRRRLTS